MRWKAILPTGRAAGERFRLCLKGEDAWGNPSDKCDLQASLRASVPVEGLPETVRFKPGAFSVVVDDLSVTRPGDLRIEMLDPGGAVLARSNPLRISGSPALRPWWGDLHGQSEETIGTNSARDFFAFARDKAFLDVCSHQGNDFQITTPFWNHLNDLTAEFNADGRFIAFPGYEWSGNTGLGGDRNVLFLEEGRQIHRSSHALVHDLSDVETDANSAEDLFEALKDEDCVVFAHIGGRYADIKMSHDARLERAVEVHSAWGTFEWLVHDAFEQGYRVGICSNSDGHKGRPGASHPGATSFGAYGGLTCMLAKDLTRRSIAECLRARHFYGTTGCRMILDTRARFDHDAERFADDPNLGPTTSEAAREAMMGDVVRSDDAQATFAIDAVASAPIERIEIRNALETLEVWRPFGERASAAASASSGKARSTEAAVGRRSGTAARPSKATPSSGSPRSTTTTSTSGSSRPHRGSSSGPRSPPGASAGSTPGLPMRAPAPSPSTPHWSGPRSRSRTSAARMSSTTPAASGGGSGCSACPTRTRARR